MKNKTVNLYKGTLLIYSLSIALLLTFAISCTKSSDEETGSPRLASSTAKPKNETTTETPVFLTKEEAIDELIDNGFEEITTLPVGVSGDLEVNPYTPNYIGYYHKTVEGVDLYTILYSYDNSVQAAEVATGNECTQDWQADKDREGCADTGNECKVVVIDENKPTIKVICCD
jgi:hypothetical protein